LLAANSERYDTGSFTLGKPMSAHEQLALAHARGKKTGVRLEQLPTNTTTRTYPVHRWFNFIAGFSPEFVEACLSFHEQKSPHKPLCLLDPFAGCGTALVTAKTMGLSSVGYDPHPFFSTISEAKVNSSAYWQSIKQIRATLSKGLNNPVPASKTLSPSAAAFLGKLFQPSSLEALLGARAALKLKNLSENPLAFLILSRMLDHCCTAATDGIYKAPSSKKRALEPKEALERVFDVVTADQVSAATGEYLSRIYCKSSESMKELAKDSIDVVVTSPPYLNNFDFAEMTRMYLYFWGIADSWGDITEKVRSKLVVNTTTALKGHKEKQVFYRESIQPKLRKELDKIIGALEEKRRTKAGKKEYGLLVYPYLSQMQCTLKECFRVMKPGATFHMMISDAALYGVHLCAPQWIAEIMKNIGYRNVECHLVRPRGHRWILEKREGAAAGLGEYYIFGNAT